jgi:hypothetical protein
MDVLSAENLSIRSSAKSGLYHSLIVPRLIDMAMRTRPSPAIDSRSSRPLVALCLRSGLGPARSFRYMARRSIIHLGRFRCTATTAAMLWKCNAPTPTVSRSPTSINSSSQKGMRTHHPSVSRSHCDIPSLGAEPLMLGSRLGGRGPLSRHLWRDQASRFGWVSVVDLVRRKTL